MRHEHSYGCPGEGDEPANEANPDTKALDLIGLLVCAALAIGLCVGLGGVARRPGMAMPDRDAVSWIMGNTPGIRAAIHPAAFSGVPGGDAPAMCSAPALRPTAWVTVPAVDDAPATRCADVIPLGPMARASTLRWF